MTIPDHNSSSQISIFLPSSRDGFYVNKSEARYIGMTEYWIPMILDFNQSYLNVDTLDKNKKTHSLFLCNSSISRVFDSFTAAEIYYETH